MDLRWLIVFISLIGCYKSQTPSSKDCVEKAKIAVTKCQKTLDERLALNDQVNEKFKTSSPDATSCCYVAEFNHCVDSDRESGCSQAINNLAKDSIGTFYKNLFNDCKDYSYPSATCYFYVWFWYIIGASAVVLILTVAICIVRCIC